MRTLLVAALLAITSAARAGTGSIGVVATTPAMGGVYGSVFVLPQLSIDARLTLATADLGLGVAIPFVDAGEHRFLVSGLGGYIHDLVTTSWLPYRGWHGAATVGYGWLTDWDLRILAGVDVAQGRLGHAATGFTASVMFGRVL